jgi:hypothetical protein
MVESQDDAHGRGLARSIGAEESGDDARIYLEMKIIDRERGTVSFGQVVDF